MDRYKVSEKRWRIAQALEQQAYSNSEGIAECIDLRRRTWPMLLQVLKGEVDIGKSKRILDIGGGPTSIFLAVRGGERYALDPAHERFLTSYPPFRDIKEYKGVTFVSTPIEEAVFDNQFDLIFSINALDHMRDVQMAADKINELLTPGGILVVAVGCYADSVVRNIIKFFDIDLPHPHHLIASDITDLFPGYRMLKRNDTVWDIYDTAPTKGGNSSIPIYRIDKLISLMLYHLREESKGNIYFALRYVACYSLALLIAGVRQKEKPIYPLKRMRLFVFQKQ